MHLLEEEKKNSCKGRNLHCQVKYTSSLMSNFDRPYGKEYVRMAILKHEETFKEQVYELHRLYRIQKIMMRNMACNKPNAQTQESESSKNWFSFNQTNHAYNLHQNSMANLDLERPAVQINVADSNGDRAVEVYTDENEIELTLGPTDYNRRKKPETSITSDSTQGLSSSSSGSSHINRTSSMNHQRTNKRREELTHQNFGFVQVSDMTLGYPSGSKTSIVLEEQLRQERLKQPPRLFQVLSLNTT